MKTIALFTILIFFNCCISKRNDTSEKNEKFIVTKNYTDIKLLETNLTTLSSNAWGSVFQYRDDNYNLYNCDMGEWGASIFFIDTITKIKTAWQIGTIYAFGKNDSSFLFFSRPGHEINSLLTIIKKPKSLPVISDTTKFCGQWEQNLSMQKQRNEILKNQNIVLEYDDIDDSLGIIGIFTKSNNIYAIKSNNFSYNSNPITILTKFNLNDKSFKVLDTLLTKTIYSKTNKILMLYKDKQYIGFRQSDRDCYFVISGDSITITYDKK